jgi:hypothetical protein
VRGGNLAASCGSGPRRGPGVLLFLAAALSPATAVAQGTRPVFTEFFAYEPAAPSQLLRNWRISSQLDSRLQPLRVGVVEDPIGKTVGRVTVQEGDGLDGANEAMLQARYYICNSEGSRAAVVEAEPSGVVPSERAEIQVRSDRATGAGELMEFGELVWPEGLMVMVAISPYHGALPSVCADHFWQRRDVVHILGSPDRYRGPTL